MPVGSLKKIVFKNNACIFPIICIFTRCCGCRHEDICIIFGTVGYMLSSVDSINIKILLHHHSHPVIYL